MISKRLFSFIIILSLSHACLGMSEAPQTPKSYPSMATFAKIAAAGVGTFVGYKILSYAYAHVKEYMKNKLVDKIVESIILAFTPNSAIEKEPAPKKEELFRKKAQLITMRKRAITKLEKLIPLDANSGLTAAHRAVLQGHLRTAKLVFGTLDLIRTENPYEKEYEKETRASRLIENKMLDSLLLATKPDKECSKLEKATKAERAVFKQKVVERLRAKVPTLTLNLILQSPLLLDSLLEQ